MSATIYVPIGHALPCAAAMASADGTETTAHVDVRTNDGTLVSLAFPSKGAAALFAEVLAKSVASLPDLEGEP